jgi:ribosomal-protein-serine acetyltransferase
LAPLARSQPHGRRPLELLRRSLKQFAENNGVQAGIWYDGRLARVVGYHGIDLQNRSIKLGYWLGKEYQGKGLISAACRALVDHALKELGLNQVGMTCAIENESSCAIPDRLGFQQEGVQRQA